MVNCSIINFKCLVLSVVGCLLGPRRRTGAAVATARLRPNSNLGDDHGTGLLVSHVYQV